MKSLFLAAFILVAAVLSADASGICRNRAALVVHTPYVAPVVTTYATTAAYVQPYAVAVATSPDYYYSLNSYYQSSLIADAVIGRLTLLNQQQPSPQPTPLPPIPQRSAPAPAPKDGPPKTSLSTGDTAALTKLVSDRCLRCHGPQKSEGGLDLSRLDAVPVGKRFAAFSLCAAEEMPRGGQPLNDEELRLFYAWARGGQSVASR
jgi:mono/diheme cytochrome c family protein